MGAFYPFSRNHNTLGAAPQELYLWPTVTEAAKNALNLRYQLLPYFYSLFADAHFHGLTVIRALWMNFPEDIRTLAIDYQFMVGSAVLISPVVDAGAVSVIAYFPKGLWYSLFDRKFSLDASSGGVEVSLNTPLSSTNAVRIVICIHSELSS